MVANYVGERSWANAFSTFDPHRFLAPTIEGVDFPKLGIDFAYNETADASLHIKTYATSSHAKGEHTQFRIVNLPAVDEVRILRDGRQFCAWEQLNDSSIVIHSKVERHRFSIYTNYRDPAAAPPNKLPMANEAGNDDKLKGTSLRVNLGDLVAVSQQRSNNTSGCSCCA
jgi:hypothetical protein